MATILRRRKKSLGSKVRGALARVKRSKSEEARRSFEAMPSMEDARQGFGTIPALDGHPSAPLPPKGDGRLHLLWETEFQDFLEGAVWEEQQLLEQITPWANTRAFLAAFEQVALACRWPRKEWATRLLPSLNEDAEKAFLSLEPPDREDFWKVKAAILRREMAARERKHLEFRRFCYQEANGPHEVHARLQELCHQWLNAEKSTKEQILEALVLEQFLNVLPKEMQNWVKERFPENCGQAVALADDFLQKLQAARQGESMETEEPALSHPKTQEVHLESVMTQIKAKRTVDEVSPFPLKAVPGYRKASVKKRGYVQWVQFGDTKLKAKFPGRANKVLPYHWKKAEDTTECRRSERLRRGRSLPLVKTPPSSPPAVPSPPSSEVKPKREKPASVSEVSKDQIKNCPDCGRDFHGVASFARHRMRHTGEKRYECCFCGKGFTWRSDLVRHECIHTGKKLHECSFCGEGFDRKWQRVQHEKTHMRGKASL
ncbi:zinc finger and SCAN domain-containing protein 23-like isoform X1 [Sceloporus undulatus]|uniref:zinc finger and SCAN domain-containing protein 23-like isoform X1 n=1 Tax=Sceloporus undulatus TaxID=8520 RepID=UPI001C4BF2D8|nr:zinc finger and SCAN domain-containing protein 23-like isoform X1 [Sceloporus undulatus]XP_042306679.1 zinc finger and SCAN domain-containing protein 23-like isoform X1 [Sceloporus undulatus]XP_042306680.1 zinc finger and SCAN domain-containing protein 23-like isoform X1 [Sceloporus undulatus]XP_042306682.1 zinc finger and SCAN domain-containing protein 23-like isoform X1 [Sceloporus undulatus]